MKIRELLTPERTQYHTHADSKKRIFELISKLIAADQEEINAREVHESLMARERLGSTTIGHGVAIPHARLAGLVEPIGALVGLKHEIEYEETDKTKVNLLFALVVPEKADETHLQCLSEIAKLFRRKSLRQRLRNAKSSEELYRIALGEDNHGN